MEEKRDEIGEKRKVLCLATFFNRKEKTVNAVQKLIEGNPGLEMHFCMLDDGSTDGSKEELIKLPNVKLLFGNGSLFYSGGMRVAIDAAKSSEDEYDFVLLFNDDVDFFTRAIEKMVSFSEESDDETITVGPTCDHQKKLSYGGVCKTSNLRPKYEIVMSSEGDKIKCDTFNANCVLIPWGIFEDLPNIPDVYGHSMGDFAYGFAASRMGYAIYVMDEYIGICDDNPAQDTWRDPGLAVSERIKKKESPKGLPFRAWFYYLRTNYSLLTAVIYSISPYIKILLSSFTGKCRKGRT